MSQKTVLEWDPVMHQGCYKANRTALIDNFALLLKKGDGIEYPRKEECRTLFNDILAVHEEMTQAGKKIWNRHPKLPDDALHAQVFGWTAMRVRVGDLLWYGE